MRHGAFDYLLKPAAVADIIASVQRGLSHRAQMLRQRDLVGLMQRAIVELQPRAGLGCRQERRTAFEAARASISICSGTSRPSNDQLLDLTLTEFKMLAYLMEHPDQVISPRELVARRAGL